MTVATGYLDLAREGDEDAFDRVETALERIDQMIDDLLTVTRADEFISETEPIDMADVTHDAWQMVETKEAVLNEPESYEIAARRDCSSY